MHPNAVAYLGGVLCAYFIAFCIWSLCGAAILQVAVAFYNMMAGGERSERGVPGPSFGKAFVIVFLTTFINLVLSVGLIIAADAGAGSGGMRSGHRQIVSMLVSQAISYPLGMIVMAGMVSSILPTNLGRALLVTLCHILVVILIGVVLVGIILAFVAAAGAR